MDNRAIGFMDSGVGGLTVVREALRQLPLESVTLLGIRPGSHMARVQAMKYGIFLSKWLHF